MALHNIKSFRNINITSEAREREEKKDAQDIIKNNREKTQFSAQ